MMTKSYFRNLLFDLKNYYNTLSQDQWDFIQLLDLNEPSGGIGIPTKLRFEIRMGKSYSQYSLYIYNSSLHTENNVFIDFKNDIYFSKKNKDLLKSALQTLLLQTPQKSTVTLVLTNESMINLLNSYQAKPFLRA